MEIKIIIDDRIVTFGRRVRALATRRRVAAVSAAGVLGLAVLANASPVTKPHTFQAGDPIRAADVNENFDALYEAFNDRVIREDYTITVPVASGCAGLRAEIENLDEYRIASTATVTIELAAGTYACSGNIAIRHPNGDRLSIVGGGNGPSDVELTFPAGESGIGAYRHPLGRVGNLTVTGGGAAAGNGSGIYTTDGSIERVENVVAQGFENGFRANSGRLRGYDLVARNNVTGFSAIATGQVEVDRGNASQNTQDGFSATQGGMVRVRDAQATSNGRDGLSASVGGVLYASGTTLADGNTRNGLVAGSGGHMQVGTGATASNSGDVGFISSEHATMILSSPSSANNVAYGYATIRGGFMRRAGTSASTGDGAATNRAVNTPDPGHGAVIQE
jgi:hypothetical protein